MEIYRGLERQSAKKSVVKWKWGHFPSKSVTLNNIEIDREVEFLDEKVDFHRWGPSLLSLPLIFEGSKPQVVLTFFLWTLRSQNYFHEPYVVQNFTLNNFALGRKNGWRVKLRENGLFFKLVAPSAARVGRSDSMAPPNRKFPLQRAWPWSFK